MQDKSQGFQTTSARPWLVKGWASVSGYLDTLAMSKRID